MIKNIIFDIGNVLATFQPKKVLSKYFSDLYIDDIYSFFFEKDRWNLYDQGIMFKEDLIKEACTTFPTLEKNVIEFMNHWVEDVIEIKEIVHLLLTYKNKGYKTYILSNLPYDSYRYLQEHSHFMHHIDGGVYSYQEKLIKPDSKIYYCLLQKYQLKANECLFIDDRLENIQAAKKIGFKTIHATSIQAILEQVESKL